MLPVEQRLRTKEQLKEWLAHERKKYGKFSKLKYWLRYYERAELYRHNVLLRKSEYYYNNHRKIMAALYLYRLKRLQNKYALHIPINTCGKGLYVMHIGPVLINRNSVVGEDCVFHMNTALVAGGTNDDSPVLGNHVVLGLGSVVLGNTHVADGVAVGANAVVNKDVLEPNIAVAGVPAKKISNNGRSAWEKR